MNEFFSNGEVPGLCLRDVERTHAFRDAIRRAVRPGSVVLDAGSGSGIMALFAAQAGARKVYAAEVDRALAEGLRQNAARNGFASVIEVLTGDVRELRLPAPVDVVIGEMIETWLLDELQVPAMNALRDHGVIAAHTAIIPSRYEAFATFGHAAFSFYGFDLVFPVHDWPGLDPAHGWLPLDFQPMADPVRVFEADFTAHVDPALNSHVSFHPTADGVINAVRLSGMSDLVNGVLLGATVAYNGDKIINIPETVVKKGQSVGYTFSGILGGPAALFRLVCRQEETAISV